LDPLKYKVADQKQNIYISWQQREYELRIEREDFKKTTKRILILESVLMLPTSDSFHSE
jgi:hypothetical protein